MKKITEKMNGKKILSFTISLLLLTNLFNINSSQVLAVNDEYLGDDHTSVKEVNPPTPDTVLPDANQYRYQKEELAAFCHFGPNTFNGIEWGEHYGQKSPDEIYRLSQQFDAESMIKTLKEAGFKKIIVTAKHHDGFAIWDTKHSDYKATNTTHQKNGEKDILKLISKAATKYNMNMGLYLSPWDIHEKSYGYYDENHRPTSKDKDVLDYNVFYNNQLEEILSSPDYGNHGHFNEVWMDGAKGNGANAQEYDFKKWFATIQKHEGIEAGYDADALLFGAEAYSTVRWIGNEHGLAAKNTWSKVMADKHNNSFRPNKQGQFTVGFENGNQWTVPEADARITSGWFWGNGKKEPKSLKDLANMYFNSVGNNSVLLLNVPPNNEGRVDDKILQRVKEFGQEIQKTFAVNLAASDKAVIKADNIRQNADAYKPGNLTDKNQETVWTTDDGKNSAKILITFNKTTTFDVVSIEEAIQFGQRINSYNVEYKKNGDQKWKSLDSGVTIGAKRLVRTPAVKADQVRISISTPAAKVPILSEIGIYKASKAFELSNSAPEGIEVYSINNSNVFKFQKKWTGEEGPQFVGSVNKWAGPGASLTFNFTGTKVYLLGTVDPNHGEADVYIDDKKIETINTKGNRRSLSQRIFTSPDLTDGPHTLKLEVKNKAIGIEAAYVINNGGKGMIGFEHDSYTMNENERRELKLKRVGGTAGRVSVRVSPNPGSAIQDDYNTELITTVVFEDGESEKMAPVATKRNKNKTGDLNFVLDLTPVDTPNLILGFNDTTVINIKDEETPDTSVLQQLVNEYKTSVKEWYVQNYEAYEQAAKKAQKILVSPTADKASVQKAQEDLQAAKEALVKREQSYSAEDPFVFPEILKRKATLEAEFGILHNTGPQNERWKLVVSTAPWASNGKFVNALNENDTISFPYEAKYTGTYQVTAVFRSGNPKNTLNYSETDTKIEAKSSITAGSSNSGTTNTVKFDMKVTKAGKGTLVFRADSNNSPQLDKLEIVMTSKDPGEMANADLTYRLNADEEENNDQREISLNLNKDSNAVYRLNVDNLTELGKDNAVSLYPELSEKLPTEYLENWDKYQSKSEIFEIKLFDENNNPIQALNQNAILSLPLKEGKQSDDIIAVYHNDNPLTKVATLQDLKMDETLPGSYTIDNNKIVIKTDSLSPFIAEYKPNSTTDENDNLAVDTSETNPHGDGTTVVGGTDAEDTNPKTGTETGVETGAEITAENGDATAETANGETPKTVEEKINIDKLKPLTSVQSVNSANTLLLAPVAKDKVPNTAAGENKISGIVALTLILLSATSIFSLGRRKNKQTKA